MRLAHIRVGNFRALREISVDVGAHTALIGGNGAGKSSILKALDKFYSTSKSLGSGLTNQSQKMTVAAMHMAEKKVWAQRS